MESTRTKSRGMRIAIVGGAAVLAISAAALVGCSGSSDPQSLYQSKCGSCHSTSTVDNANYSGDQWADVVNRMKDKSSSISDSDAQTITQYLQNR